MREKIAPERSAPDGAAARERKRRRNEHREQIARQYPAEPPVIKPLHVRDPSARADERTVEQKAGEQQREIHEHVPAAHDALKIEIVSGDPERRIEPRLLPDVEPRYGEDAKNAENVRRGEVPAAGVYRERISHLNSVPFTVIMP